MRKRKYYSPMMTRRRHGRGLRIEHLEPRCLLAGDTYLINFQPDEATPVTRYLVDSGLIFGDRGGGLSYGWSSDHNDQARERSVQPDQRLDTLIHFEVGQNWEFALPNGNYEVTATVGDPTVASNHTLNVEGINFWGTPNPISLAANQFATKTMAVTVSDGRLTLDQGAAPNMATRINYVHIVGLPSGPNAAPAAPTVTEPAVDGQEVNPSDVHMEATGFSDPDVGDVHKSTDWEIWTVGPGAEPVWQTLGIESVEKVHTHLGDGVFMNSRAGQTNLAGNTDHELRVRFRDDAGSVSSYATRLFHTGPEFAVFPLEIQDVVASPAPTWTDIFAAPVELPDGTTILSPGDPIIAIDTDGFGSASPGNEQVFNAIDGDVATKYLNFGQVNSGFVVTPSSGSSIVTGFQITTANDAVERDPTTWELRGTNDPITSANHSDGSQENWSFIASGNVNLPSARFALGPLVSFPNSTAYSSYRMVFTGVKDLSANSMQIAEIEFFGDLGGMPTPPELRIEAGDTGEELLSIEGSELAGNLVTHFPPLGGHANLRVVVETGSTNLVLNQSNLTFRDEDGLDHTIYLPAINLGMGQRLDLWVTTVGSTYYGTAAQTEPVFTSLARQAPVPGVPFVTTQPGYVVEVVGTNYRLPVNIAFVPNPGPDPDDPLYFVTELYGSIQVVTRDGTKQTFATGLLDYNPQGPISGSGEQGLTGIAVQRDAVDPEIYHLYVGMLWDNGSPPGGATHYPKVERIDSAPGGLTMATRTVLLNMQPETQGQSHQISNVSIGPDGKLYVHNGDGFTTSTAQDLNQFRGKILRMNLDGTPASDNPFYNGAPFTARDYVFAYGFRNPFGGAWRASNDKHYTVENGPSVDRLSELVAGRNYLWNGTDQSMTNFAIYNWNPAHAPVNITFIQPATFGGSQFPAGKMDHAFVSESGPTYAPGPQANGKRIVEFELDANGNRISGPTTLVEYVGQGQSSVVGLAAGPDGLYFTELYEESGASGPTAIGARIFRVRYVNPVEGDYDVDGNVDNDDNAVWRANFGSNLLLAADGNHNGEVDAADYVMWRKAMTAGLAAATTTTASSAAVSPSLSASTSVAASGAVGEAGNLRTGPLAGPADEPSAVEGTARLGAIASAQTIDLALADLHLKPGSNFAARSAMVADSRPAALAHDRIALLLALPAEVGAAEHPANAAAGEMVRSPADGDAPDVDGLFAELRLELVRW